MECYKNSSTKANCFLSELIPIEKGHKNESDLVASPEKIPIYLNPIAVRMAKTPWSLKLHGVLAYLSAAGLN